MNICESPIDGFVDFEDGIDGNVIQSSIPGLQFTTTEGYDWIYGDWQTGNYNGPYPNGSYISNDNIFAWLGPNQGNGRIDFIEGTATYLSILTSTYSGLVIDAYDHNGNFLTSSGWATNNLNTGEMTRLTVSAENIAYVIIHDTGNYWLIDDLCTDAEGVPPIYPEIARAAMSVLGAPYQWGAKGYDYATQSFTTAEKILNTKYKYYDPYVPGVTLGKGLDCSGLNMWAYNRTFYGDQVLQWDKDYTCEERDGSTKCPIFYQKADDQWRSNTTKQLGTPQIEDLHMGDLLFFNTKGRTTSDGGPVMDHTAMYVGPFEFTQGNVYNVIHASGYTNSVVPAWYNEETGKLITQYLPPHPDGEQYLDVTGWGEVSDPRLDAWVIIHSPVYISVTDPDGQTVSKENNLADENGNTIEIPGMSYMITDIDGETSDTVAIAELKQGAYFIEVEPKPDVMDTDTYSLEIRFPDLGEEPLWPAQDVEVSPHIFVVEVDGDNIAESTYIEMKIKPYDSVPRINTKSKGNIPIVLFGSEAISGELISTDTIQIDNDSDRTTDSLLRPMKVALADVNNDGYEDVVLHFDTQELNINGLLQDEQTVFITAQTHDENFVIGKDIIHVVGGTQ